MIQSSEKRPEFSHVLNDPSAEGVAAVYAKAFLRAAGSEADSAVEELSSFVEDVVYGHPDFGRMLMTDVVSHDGKLALLQRVVMPVASDVLGNFLRVLAEHDRLELLPLVSDLAVRQRETANGRRRVLVRSARPLTDEQRGQVYQQLRDTFGIEPIVEEQTDPSLLGGLVIRIGDTVYDGSLKKRLRQLRDRLQTRCVHEIQIGRDRFSSPTGD